MIVHQWGEIEYIEARQKMDLIHQEAMQDGKNHLILCSHPNVFTVGVAEKEQFGVSVVQSDRGGSITCHSAGQNIFYFCFQVKNPARFYKKVLQSFEKFFAKHLPSVKYDKNKSGFYIQNRKIASLGFRYSRGVSLHGVSLNVAVDLAFHSQINPCNLEGIVPTSLHAEKCYLTQEEVNKELVKCIEESFCDAPL